MKTGFSHGRFFPLIQKSNIDKNCSTLFLATETCLAFGHMCKQGSWVQGILAVAQEHPQIWEHKSGLCGAPTHSSARSAHAFLSPAVRAFALDLDL